MLAEHSQPERRHEHMERRRILRQELIPGAITTAVVAEVVAVQLHPSLKLGQEPVWVDPEIFQQCFDVIVAAS